MPEPHVHWSEVPGSVKHAPSGAQAVGPVPADEYIEATVVLRPRAGAPVAQSTGTAPLSREEYAARHGADPADIAAVEDFAHEHDLDVLAINQPARTVQLGGKAAAITAAFQVELARYEHAGGQFRGRTGAVKVPASLAEVVQAVMGLDDRPAVHPHFRPHDDPQLQAAPFTPLQVAALYDFPDADGSGQTIAIIELGGGYRRSDLRAYFAEIGVPMPKVSSVSVDGGRNAPTGDPNGPDGEVLLDIEVAGAIAPNARIAVYFAPNTDAGFLGAINAAVHDSVRNPSVISISWGAAESGWTQQSMTAFDDAFAAAGAMGVSVFAASGDDGSDDRVGDGAAHVDFPASSPHVTGCGGTRLIASGDTIASETVWNHGPGQGAGGGGISAVFPVPDFQTGMDLPGPPTGGSGGRGVPDLAANADPATGYRIRVDGEDAVVGGTSAVAPLMAGLVARLNQLLGRSLGQLNSTMYALPKDAGAFRDVTEGDNGAYSAGPGWDACTGWGSPVGGQLLAALSAQGAATTLPQQSSIDLSGPAVEQGRRV